MVAKGPRKKGAHKYVTVCRHGFERYSASDLRQVNGWCYRNCGPGSRKRNTTRDMPEAGEKQMAELSAAWMRLSLLESHEKPQGRTFFFVGERAKRSGELHGRAGEG
jgi:hypothetical protein